MPASFGEVTVDMSVPTPIVRALETGSYAGIVIQLQDVLLLQDVPGLITDLTARRLVVADAFGSRREAHRTTSAPPAEEEDECRFHVNGSLDVVDRRDIEFSAVISRIGPTPKLPKLVEANCLVDGDVVTVKTVWKVPENKSGK